MAKRLRLANDGPPPAERLAQLLEWSGLGGFKREYRFAWPDRRWEIDFAYVEEKLAVEYEGGTWIGGGHNIGGRFHRDVEKYNEMAIRGWALLRITSDMIPEAGKYDNMKGVLLVERTLAAIRQRKGMVT